MLGTTAGGSVLLVASGAVRLQLIVSWPGPKAGANHAQA